MAAPGKKKIIQQDELRRLMKAKQRETAAKKKIESPLAKYNSLGQLSCVVCNIPIKSELLWQTHILGKQHKEKVAELKGANVKDSRSPVSTLLLQTTKRKGPVLESLESKRIKDSEDESSASSKTSALPPGFFETGDQSCDKKTPVNAPIVRLLAGNYDDDEEEDGENVPAGPSSTQQSMEIPLPPPTTQDSSLPPDFFDSKTPLVSHSGSILKADIQEKAVERKENTAEALPEGFFDDPEVDAKVRKVDAPKDHLDKEWEEFQKEMRQVNTQTKRQSGCLIWYFAPVLLTSCYMGWLHPVVHLFQDLGRFLKQLWLKRMRKVDWIVKLMKLMNKWNATVVLNI
ncbi:zinc finger protein 830 isoform X2 [Dendrobates tinctorius]|uniref:zinc finger protein 830 isoform X2 n=1 Tax=Dendrobates tinctorius TaxID=92724 RepID=UPI003CC9C22F